jgi:hypothetical protein
MKANTSDSLRDFIPVDILRPIYLDRSPGRSNVSCSDDQVVPDVDKKTVSNTDEQVVPDIINAIVNEENNHLETHSNEEGDHLKVSSDKENDHSEAPSDDQPTA